MQNVKLITRVSHPCINYGNLLLNLHISTCIIYMGHRTDFNAILWWDHGSAVKVNFVSCFRFSFCCTASSLPSIKVFYLTDDNEVPLLAFCNCWTRTSSDVNNTLPTAAVGVRNTGKLDRLVEITG